MSQRTADARRAVNAAWEKEIQLVREGKGTRDWSPEQQRSILEKGKAYDESGRSIEGHHMKSVQLHPELQGEPENIQFLTKVEHRNAHGGNYQNPTNGYYDPITRVTTDFGDGPYMPCAIIDLSHPIVPPLLVEETAADSATPTDEPPVPPSDTAEQVVDIKPNGDQTGVEEIVPAKAESSEITKATKAKHKNRRMLPAKVKLRKAKEWVINHPGATHFIAKMAVNTLVDAGFQYVIGKKRVNARIVSGSHRGVATSKSNSVKDSVAKVITSAVDTVETTPRSGFTKQHTVKAHGQHYHGKWVEKAPYQRGGKK